MMWPESRYGRADAPSVETGLSAVMPLPPMRVMIRVFAGERMGPGHAAGAVALGRELEVRSTWHLYVIQLDAALELRRREVFERMRAAGVGVNVHYIPVHLQPYHRDLWFREGDFPNADRYHRRAITLPLHPGPTHAQQDRAVAAFGEAIA